VRVRSLPLAACMGAAENPRREPGIGGTNDAAASTTRAIHRDDEMVGSARRPGEWSAAEQMDV